jgi:hypothetical protein
MANAKDCFFDIFFAGRPQINWLVVNDQHGAAHQSQRNYSGDVGGVFYLGVDIILFDDIFNSFV